MRMRFSVFGCEVYLHGTGLASRCTAAVELDGPHTEEARGRQLVSVAMRGRGQSSMSLGATRHT